MNKVYSRINWENYPSEKTPVNEANLNKIDYATNEIDNRVISLDTSKLDKTTANGMVKNVTYNSTNGVFTVTYLNGTTASIDTKLEKMAVNFVYDAENERLVITLDDGTKQYVDMKSLITQYEFNSSGTISFTISSEGKVQADVKNGSITSDKLQPNYLADITVQAGIAQTSAGNAENSADLAETYAIRAEEAAEHAENVSDVQIMTPTQIGIGKPDNITIGVNNGTFETKFKTYTSLTDLGLTAPKTCLEIATAMPNGSQIMLQTSSIATTVTDTPTNMGKLTIERINNARCYAYFSEYTGESGIPRMYARYIRPVINSISDWTEYLTTGKIANNLLATEAGTALDAVQGKELDTRVTTNATDIATINSKLNQYQYIITYTAAMGSILDIRSNMESGTSKVIGFFSSALRPSDFPATELGTMVYAIMVIRRYAGIAIIDITNIRHTGSPNHISGYYASNTGLLWGSVY